MGGFGGQAFQALSLADKDAYLREFSPAFKGMNPQDQSAYLNEVHYGPGIDPAATSLKQAALGVTPAGVQVLPSGESESIPRAVGRMALAVPGEVVRGVGGGIAGLPHIVAHPVETITQGIPQMIEQKAQRVEAGDPFVGLETAGEVEALRAGVPALGRGLKAISPTSAIIEHPTLTTGATTVGGAALGEAMRGTGEFGGLGGMYAGYRLGEKLVKSAEEKAISQAVEGSRSLDKLPTRLMPRYMRELNARANAYARQAIESGQPVETLKLPSRLQEATERSYEEQVRMRPQMPRAVLTPEELQEMQQRHALSVAAREQMRPEAQARGMAHAAGKQEEIWRPMRRGIKTSTTQSYKTEPKSP